ncbi:MAG: glycerol-3-phosphate 1-O-acyltransferase PlsY [Acidobacteriota bacterium]|nr:glycerol-3-phosphate 1-O-acyltransferase PlsY [Acidobacteriota bacterium]
MSPIALTLICMCVSFALCGIPFGLLVARAQGIDVRKVGSGNIGMTNVARSVGAGAAALTFALDVLKGTVCVLLARALLAYACLGGDWAQTAPQGAYGWSAALVWATCVCGHVFSPYLGFRGGKGISVGLGAGLGLCWPVALLALSVFLLVAVPSGFVSLGSICAAVALPAWGLVFRFTPGALLPTVVVCVVVIWSHRENIRRLRAGTEHKFSLRRT